MQKLKVLNLYACLGGNRYKWDEVAKEEIINGNRCLVFQSKMNKDE